MKTPYERGKEARSAELGKFLKQCNEDFAKKLHEDEEKTPEDESRFNMYDRGVIVGAIVANKTILKALGLDEEPKEERRIILLNEN